MRGAMKLGTSSQALIAAAFLVTSATTVAATAVPAAAQSPAAIRFDIPAQPLLGAIVLFNRQSGFQITAEGGVASGRTTAAVKGNLPPARALQIMLAGTGLTWHWIDHRTVSLASPKAARKAYMLDTLLVQASQQAAEGGTQVLPEVLAKGERADESYIMGTGVDTGTTRITDKEIKARSPGSGDANQLLKILPTVQFSRDEGLATREDVQDIRPSNISISGGRYYENLITIDGIDANARVDITQNTASSYLEPAGASAQSMWVDSNLVGQITLRDSNVSAEYGRFTGGALDIQTRSPKRAWGMSGSVSYTSDALTAYKVSEGSRAALGSSAMPEAPSYTKSRFGVSVDVPVSKNVGLLLAFNRSQANVTYTRTAAYGSTRYGQSSTSDNFLAKAEADLGPQLRLTGQFVYTPYTSQSASSNDVDNQVVTKGGGIVSKLQLAHSGTTDWAITGSLSHSNTGREAPGTRYSIPYWTTNGAVCSSTNCSIGGYGDIDQTQDNYVLTGRWSRKVGPGTLAVGGDYQKIEAMRSRPENNAFYSLGTAQSLAGRIVCADGNSMTCTTGEYALTQYVDYKAFTARVNLDSVASWAEYNLRLGAVSLRAGIRHDYESFLGNHNFSPRLSASYNLPWDGWSVTLGANRYYGRSMLAYALREQYPATYTYRRTGVTSGSTTTYADSGWYLYSIGYATSYSDSRKKTPYSDELSAAVSGRVLGGMLRVKGIYRDGKDEFTRSDGETRTALLVSGRTTTYTNYTISNDGFSSYRGGSVEWVRSFGKHSLAINANYSKTKSSNDTYLVDTSDLTDATMVAFKGQAVSTADLEQMNARENMSSPLIVNATWTGQWFHDRLTTNVNMRYRGGFNRIEETSGTQIIDGVSYQVYDYVRYPKAVDINLNTQFEVIRSKLGSFTVETRVANLLNRTPSPNSTATSQPYQYGRSFWVGMSYKY